MRFRFAAVLLLVLTVSLSANADSLLHPGMARIYGAEKITVVYPAGDDADRERNRLSAERRARFLKAVHDIEARVAPDRELAGKSVSGHLLLLGWNNALLGDLGDRPVVSRDDAALDFLGVRDTTPGADLVFCHVSPWDPEALLCFWSRIEPELDRPMILPIVGSDWAIYHDYQIVVQGNFDRAKGWPPRRNQKAEMDHRPFIEDERKRLRTHRTARYDVVYDPELFGRQQVEAIGKARDRAFATAVSFLGDPGESYRVTLFVYLDEDAKQIGAGIPGPATSIPRSRELHMTPRYARSSNAHEEIHLVARERIGTAASSAIYEGLSFARDEVIQGQSLEVLGAYLLGKGNLPTPEELLDEELFRSMPPAVSHPAAGLLVAWLEDETTPERFNEIYRLEEPTPSNVARLLGRNVSELAGRFKAYVVERTSSMGSEVAFLDAQEEARDAHFAGDYPALVTALKKSLKARPGDPQTIFNLASAEMRTGAYEDAEKNLQAVLADESLPADHTLKIFAHYQLGRLFDVQGRREEALACYRRVLELPDRRDSHRSARDAIAYPVTADALE